jgi:ketosteroid isomerase-like protein
MASADKGTTRAIEAEEAGLHDALMSTDLRWFEEHWAPDAVYVHMSGGVDDLSGFIERLRSKATEYFGRETGEVQIRQYGDSAVVTGWSSIDVALKGERKLLDTRFTRVYAKLDGRWRLVSSQSGATNNNPIKRHGRDGG